MGIRTDPADPTLHHIDCRPDGYKGKRVREDFRGTREEAEEYYVALMQRPMSRPLPQARTLQALWPEYLEWCRANRSPNTAANIKVCWDAHLCGHFGPLQPKMLTRALVESYKQRRLRQRRRPGDEATVKPRTVTKELHYLSGMIAWAVRMEYCAPLPFKIEGFPARLTRAPKARPLTFEQVESLLAALPDWCRLPVLLMVDAGLRAGEAFGLRACDVDLPRGVIYVTGKGNKERIIPIATSRLRVALEDAARSCGGDGYLTINRRTGRPYRQIRGALASAGMRAGIAQHVYPHLLRHTFGTLATAVDVTQASLQSMMGHSSPATTAIYQTLAAEQLREQAAKLGARVDQGVCPHGQSGHPGNVPK